MNQLTNYDTLIRLLVSALLGSLVGFERERLLWAVACSSPLRRPRW